MPTNVIDITAGGNTTIPFDTFFTATIKNFKKGMAEAAEDDETATSDDKTDEKTKDKKSA